MRCTMRELERLLNVMPLQPEVYADILEAHGWEQPQYREFMMTRPVWMDMELRRVEKADFSLCCALLTALLREDHFSNGAFAGRVRNGDVKRLLHRMCVLVPAEGQTVSKRPQNRASIGTLLETKCSAVPNENGVYFVESASEPLCFLPNAAEDSIPTYPVSALQTKWEAGDRRCLYIGKAARQGGLKKRLWEYVGYGYGLKKNHRGGRAVWQVQGFEDLTIRWEVVPDANQTEHELLRYYKRTYGTYPVANWRG